MLTFVMSWALNMGLVDIDMKMAASWNDLLIYSSRSLGAFPQGGFRGCRCLACKRERDKESKRERERGMANTAICVDIHLCTDKIKTEEAFSSTRPKKWLL